jgi:hypothetical protein
MVRQVDLELDNSLPVTLRHLGFPGSNFRATDEE